VISTEGLITVSEAARRLDRSTEQVRRYLREGKLKGQRIGNQWFIDEGALARSEEEEDAGWLISRKLLREIDEHREAMFRRNGIVFDIVRELREDRDSR
jgi:excisionase family DNA binding protein